MNQKAIIIGSTGLIGNHLLKYLIMDENFNQVIAFVRKPTPSNNKKLSYVVTDFKQMEKIETNLQGDVLFVCVGTTMAKAGSKEAFLKIDYNIPVDMAHLAVQNGVKSCVVVSSLGADPHSANFYLQTKGKMEQAIEKLGFKNTVFMRPSILFGAREEFRFGELIGKFLMKVFGPFFLGSLKKYKGIAGKTVAKAMLIASLHPINGVKKYESNEIENLAK